MVERGDDGEEEAIEGEAIKGSRSCWSASRVARLWNEPLGEEEKSHSDNSISTSSRAGIDMR